MTTATTTNPTTTTATYKKLNALSDPEACLNFLMNIKNKLRGARVIETIDGVKTDRGNLTRLLNSRVYPVAGGRERLGVEDITAPARFLGGVLRFLGAATGARTWPIRPRRPCGRTRTR